MAKPKVVELIKQIERTRGNVSAIARAYDVSRTAVYLWISASPTLQQALDDSRERMVDDAESVLYKQVVQDQNMQAVMYVLNNSPQAKRRGWGPKQEIEHSGKGEDGAIPVRFIDYRTGLEGDDSTDAAG